MKRLEKLRAELRGRGLDAMLITKDENPREFEGFLGSECYYLVTGEKSYLIADSRYTEMAAHDCRNAEVVPHRDPYPLYNEIAASLCADAGVKKLAFEAEDITYAQYAAVYQELEKAGIEMVPTAGLCENIRAVKDEEEIACLSRACEIADEALKRAVPRFRPGITEKEAVRILEAEMAELGSEAPSFDTMVLFGARSSQPHAVPAADVALKAGDLILIDYGAVYKGYHSDTTRTFVSGAADARQKENYARVLAAQKAGVNAVRVGAATSDVDKASRDILLGEGCFGHGVGHGVGLEIHEEPSLRRASCGGLCENMAVTVEPGLYLPDWGGIRIEDTVIVGADGPVILTHFPKEELISL